MIVKTNAPVILIVSFQNYTGISHLPKVLSEAGFSVCAVCPRNGHLSQTKFLKEVYPLPEHTFYWLFRKVFLKSVKEAKPVLLIPGDDAALAFLQNLMFQLPSGEFKELLSLLKHSLGFPEYYRACTDKAAFGKMCESIVLNTPEQYLCLNTSEVVHTAARLGFPLVFKKTLSCGGTGVHICHNMQELRAHATGFFGTGIHKLMDWLKWEVHKARGWDIRHLMQPQEELILLQKYIEGKVISHTFVTWKGEYLAGFTYENQNKGERSKDPSRNIRIVDHVPESEEIARKLACHLGFTGFACIDLIKDKKGEIFLLECNARPTHTVVYGREIGLDLGRMLFETRTLDQVPHDGIRNFALFPDAYRENPDNFDANTSRIPWDDPKLFCSLLQECPGQTISIKWLVSMVYYWTIDKLAAYRNRKLMFSYPVIPDFAANPGKQRSREEWMVVPEVSI
ncbi:Carbamoyl-phosphate synthase large chain [Dyadobacter sp. CECT 9275]|uniref:Carbamoyl-phosphate synthase large chain n=1 Tax=Dyadobacter helix TaxID=2822344 RepID=A0A916JGR8_9BACT|nr:ATP-grasp domain-containing protein [Dyadobacter sp. CECT 9275]CAG5012074.1 Carbamoyl-phosphate synthase large chain [Dyadobacter sp. CECT 9275]